MKRLRKILGKSYYFLFFRYLRLRFWYPVWFYLLNHGGRQMYQKERSGLLPVQRRINRDLKKDGIALTNVLELFPKETWEELVSYANLLAKKKQNIKRIAKREAEPPKVKSDIIIHLLGGYGDTQPPLDLGDSFIRFALSNTILRTVATYLRVLPKFRMFSLHSTILLPPRAPTVFSQNWHRDPDDMKLVKVFLYLSDVDSPKAGPFMYVRGSQFGAKYRHIFPQRPPMGSYPPAGAVEARVAPGDILICNGRAGTLIFCDTSGLHRGGHSVGKRRLMFAATYVTQAGLKYNGANYQIKSKKSDISSLSDIARWALSL